MKYLFIFLLTIGVSQPEGQDFVIKLKDSSIFKVKLEIKEFNVKTELGKLDVPIKDVKSIKAVKEGFVIKVKKDLKESVIQGKIDKSFSLKTRQGTLNIKMEDISEMIPTKKMILNDDSVVGFWDFSGDEDLKLTGGKHESEDSINAVKLNLADGDTIEIPHKDEFNSKDALTVEIKFKINDLTLHGNYIYLIQKSKVWADGGSTFLIALKPDEKKFFIGAHCSDGTMPHTYPVVPLEKDKWHHFSAVIDAKNKNITGFFDGAKVDVPLTTAFTDNKLRTNDSSIYVPSHAIGKHPSTMWIDYIRISNTARSEDEIKEMWESGSLGSSFKPPTDKEYNAVIITKQSERYSCKLDNDKIKFESSLGDVQVDKNKIDKILYFEYRKEQIEKLHKEARGKIAKLSSDDPTERDKAEDELKKMGWVILPILEEFKSDKDEEVKSRVQKLIEGYSGRKYEIKKDLIEGNGLLLRGWVKHEKIKAKTKYGDIEISEEDIKGIIFNINKSKSGNIVFTLKDGSQLSGKLTQEKMSLSTDFGKLEIAVDEILSLTIGKDEDTIFTKKSTLKGVISQEEFELESQIGKIKIRKDQINAIKSESP